MSDIVCKIEDKIKEMKQDIKPNWWSIISLYNITNLSYLDQLINKIDILSFDCKQFLLVSILCTSKKFIDANVEKFEQILNYQQLCSDYILNTLVSICKNYVYGNKLEEEHMGIINKVNEYKIDELTKSTNVLNLLGNKFLKDSSISNKTVEKHFNWKETNNIINLEHIVTNLKSSSSTLPNTNESTYLNNSTNSDSIFTNPTASRVDNRTIVAKRPKLTSGIQVNKKIKVIDLPDQPLQTKQIKKKIIKSKDEEDNESRKTTIKKPEYILLQQRPIVQQDDSITHASRINYALSVLENAGRKNIWSPEQIVALKDVFMNANKATDDEINLMLGFLSGNRDNKIIMPNPITLIKLNEHIEEAKLPDGTNMKFMIEMLFEMNFNTGIWKRLKRTRRLAQ